MVCLLVCLFVLNGKIGIHILLLQQFCCMPHSTKRSALGLKHVFFFFFKKKTTMVQIGERNEPAWKKDRYSLGFWNTVFQGWETEASWCLSNQWCFKDFLVSSAALALIAWMSRLWVLRLSAGNHFLSAASHLNSRLPPPKPALLNGGSGLMVYVNQRAFHRISAPGGIREHVRGREARQRGLQGAGPPLNRFLGTEVSFFLEGPGLWSCKKSIK